MLKAIRDYERLIYYCTGIIALECPEDLNLYAHFVHNYSPELLNNNNVEALKTLALAYSTNKVGLLLQLNRLGTTEGSFPEWIYPGRQYQLFVLDRAFQHTAVIDSFFNLDPEYTKVMSE